LYCFLYYKVPSLVVGIANTFIDDVKHGLSLNGGSSDKSGETKHGKTSIVNLGLLSNTRGESGKVTIWLRGGGITVRVNKERVREWKRAQGSEKSYGESVNIGNEDDGSLIGNGVLARDGCKGSPLLEVKGNISIRDKPMSLGVGSGADDNPTEHGVAAVPLLGLDGGSPSELSELRVILVPFLHGIIENAIKDVEVSGGPG
jgi:hypothetical protein